MAPTTSFAASETGHIGGKPDIGQGDGVPQTKPGTIRAGEQLAQGAASMGDGPGYEGSQNNSGNASHGGDANERGDGIPNGGPIEGQQGQGNTDSGSYSSWLSLLFGL